MESKRTVQTYSDLFGQALAAIAEVNDGLKAKGFPDDTMVSAELIAKMTEAGKVYEKFCAAVDAGNAGRAKKLATMLQALLNVIAAEHAVAMLKMEVLAKAINATGGEVQ